MSENSIKTRVHFCLDLEGALMNFKKREWRNVVKDDNGLYLSPDAVKRFFLEELKSGKRVIPYGPTCEGFSFETGCPGHPVE